MKKYYGKKDRTARLLRLQIFLSQHLEGKTLEQIASECSISQRTVYRDLKTLERELNVPLWMDRGRYGIMEGYYLPPVVFSNEEAINIFLAVRLMQNLSYQYDPTMASTFNKLCTVVPLSLKLKIQNTLEFMKKQPIDERKLRVFGQLVQAWLRQHIVHINYLEQYGKEPVALTIEPYFIEPSILGHSSYLIAFCREQGKVCAFKVDAIIGEVTLGPETYEIPQDFNAADYIGSEWDVHLNKDLEIVKLRFNAKSSKRAAQTIWHPSQIIEQQSDGSIIMTFKVRDITYFRAFILGWGDDVEVLEPEKLRKQLINIVYSLESIYDKSH
jgi:predicted DNA-binding transcriptional regulator YafY